jgi:hypothetical protein
VDNTSVWSARMNLRARTPQIARLRTRAAARVALALAGLVVALSACKPQEGKSCRTEARETCTSKTQALVCHDTKWEAMMCRGPAGCQKVGSDAQCDQSVASENDVCNLPDDVVCAPDARAMLECKSHRWVRTASCLGAGGCALSGKKVKCDNSVAALGEACSNAKDYACSADHKVELVCKDGKFAVSSTCRGPKGCAVVEGAPGDTQGRRIMCDDTRAQLNDSCNKAQSYTCDMDGKAIYVCHSGHYVLDEACKGRLNCRVLGTKVGCF